MLLTHTHLKFVLEPLISCFCSFLVLFLRPIEWRKDKTHPPLSIAVEAPDNCFGQPCLSAPDSPTLLIADSRCQVTRSQRPTPGQEQCGAERGVAGRGVAERTFVLSSAAAAVRELRTSARFTWRGAGRGATEGVCRVYTM